jgi:hypothetical protein
MKLKLASLSEELSSYLSFSHSSNRASQEPLFGVSVGLVLGASNTKLLLGVSDVLE